MVWSQSVITEAWTLNTLIFVAALYLASLWFGEKRQNPWVFCLIIFLTGSLAVNTRFMIILIPLPFLLLVKSHYRSRWFLFAGGMAALILSFFWFAVPLLCAHNGSPVMWVDVSISKESFLHLIGQGQCEKVDIMRHLHLFKDHPVDHTILVASQLFRVAHLQYQLIYWIPAFIGVVTICINKGRRLWGCYLLTNWFVLGFCHMGLITFMSSQDLQHRIITRVFYIPFFLVTAVFIGYGLVMLSVIIKRGCADE